jgi:hypothetical protein
VICLHPSAKVRYKDRWWLEGVEPSLRGTVGMEAKRGKPASNQDRAAVLEAVWYE